MTTSPICGGTPTCIAGATTGLVGAATTSPTGTQPEPPASVLPVRRPGTHRAAAPQPVEPPGDPVDRAWDLLAQTCDLPTTERGLLKVLVEYRKALHALATYVQTIRRAQPGAQP